MNIKDSLHKQPERVAMCFILFSILMLKINIQSNLNYVILTFYLTFYERKQYTPFQFQRQCNQFIILNVDS